MNMRYKCCHQDQNCPEVTIDGDNVKITDDFGKEITMTIKQLDVLIDKYLEANGLMKAKKEAINSFTNKVVDMENIDWRVGKKEESK
jgi:hypothetical protein